MKVIFKFLALAIVAALAGSLTTLVYHTALGSAARPSLDLTYADFLSITLTALSLMITVLGFFVAAASVIGWTTIENKLRDHSVNYFKDQLKKDGQLRNELEELIESIAYEGIESLKSSGETLQDEQNQKTKVQNLDTEYRDDA